MSPALLAGLSAAVVGAYVERNHVPAAELPALLANVHAGLSALASGRRAVPVPALSAGPTSRTRRTGRAS